MTKIAGSGSGSESRSISQRHGSADPDPDTTQNVMVPQHCRPLKKILPKCRSFRTCVRKFLREHPDKGHSVDEAIVLKYLYHIYI